jgi:4'-phosphopantetheinyl transferase EntD
MSWLQEWQDLQGTRLYLGPLNHEAQIYDLDPSISTSRSREKFALQRIIDEKYPELIIAKDVHGKPYFPKKELHINYSHSATHLFWGEHEKYALGVDVEITRSQLQRVAHKYCNETELNYTDNGVNTALLVAIWSAKEAMFKAYGKGAIDFRTDMQISPFTVEEEGTLIGFFGAGINVSLNISYRRFNNMICTWVLWV